MLRDATDLVDRRRILGLVLAVAGFVLVIVGFAASPDRLGQDDQSGLPWAMVAGLVLGVAGDAYRARQAQSKARALRSAIVVAAAGAVVALFGLLLIWTLSPTLSPTKLSGGALLITELGLFLAGVAFYLWAQGSPRERRAKAIPLVFVGGILAEVGLYRYLPLSQDTGGDIAYGILILTAIGAVLVLARRIRRRVLSARTLGGER